MKKVLLLLTIALALAGCAASTSPAAMDRHVSTHEPKTGGPDL